MAAWLPALKAALPYLTQVVSVAAPMFTKKPASSASQEIITEQISELQDAVTNNAESLKSLATQLQVLLKEIEAASARAEKEVRATKRLSYLAIVIAIIAIIISLN